ncbi:MAG: hypothetical protein KDB00_06170, partial [Planctomycetales bacterium]|nr:hypothetical protein [Planctomycetales bacterium]
MTAIDQIHRFLDHPRKTLFAWSVAVVSALLFVLPAWDDFSAARAKSYELDSEIHEVTLSV